jgi:hypothetical protein
MAYYLLNLVGTLITFLGAILLARGLNVKKEEIPEMKSKLMEHFSNENEIGLPVNRGKFAKSRLAGNGAILLSIGCFIQVLLVLRYLPRLIR